MAKVADHLVGRAAELDAIDRALGELRDGRPAPLVIEGEPGIGKTRLLAELAERADARGCIVLGGSASELERDLPFWVFVDALDEYVAGLDPRRRRVPARRRAQRARARPARRCRTPHPQRGPVLQDERYRAHRAVRELLERLAAAAPLVLVLDDVHWADAASVELLAALLRSPPDAAVLSCWRRARGSGPIASRRRSSAPIARAASTRVELGGLPREAAGELLGDDVGRERADALYEESGGNPFYLQQLARSHGRRRPRAAAGADAALEAVGVPPAVIASLAEELALLSADTRRVLRGRGGRGRPVRARAAPPPRPCDETAAAMEAFDELLALGLVRATDVPRRFRFRHPLVRRAVYESAPGGWLLGAHERCARSLARARRAAGRARAPRRVRRAPRRRGRGRGAHARPGRRRCLRAPASAARWFSAALRLLPGRRARRAARRAAHRARARALAATGRARREPTPTCSRASRSLPARGGRACACGSRRPAPASSTCSASTRRRTRAWPARSSSSRTPRRPTRSR